MESTGEAITIPAILDGMNIPRVQQSPNAKQRVAGILKMHSYEEARKWIDKKANRSQRYWRKVFHLHSSMVPNGSHQEARQTGAKAGNHWGTIEENPMVPNAQKESKGTIEKSLWFPTGSQESLDKQGREPLEPLEPLDSVYKKNFGSEKPTNPKSWNVETRTFETDADALVGHLLNGAKGLSTADLQNRLGWDESRWQQAKNVALQRGIIYCQGGCWFALEARP